MSRNSNRQRRSFAPHNRIFTADMGKRLLSCVLCLCMTAAMLCNFGGWVLSSAFAAEATGNVMSRVADGDTSDTYIGKLLSDDWGSRYAGRVWTDKSVFAFGNNIGLDMDTDGYDGTVKFNSDFGTIFSALSSSQVVKENPPQPLDVMFVLDVSGSMGKNGSVLVDKANFTDSAISKTVVAVNNAISLLLKNNPNSRFGIVVYGSTAAVLVPLAHYTSAELSTKFIEVYGGTQGLHFSLTATVQQKDGSEIRYYADNAGQTNNEAHNRTEGTSNRTYHGTGGNTTGNVKNENNPIHVGHITNPQAGLAVAMNEFIEENNELTWNTIVEDKEYLRLPALIHLTDGQASDLAWIQPEAESSSSEAWKKTASNWNNVNWKYDLAYNSPLNVSPTEKNYYNASQLTGYGDAAPVIFQTLMTAAYYKSAVEAYYNSTGVTDKDGKPVALSCYSIYASDEKNYSDLSDNQVKATIDAILGPEEHFKDSTGELKNSGKLNANNSVDEYIDTAYELYKAWKNNGATNITFSENTTSSNSSSKNDNLNEIAIMLNTTKEQLENGSGRYSSYDWCNISVADIEKNINYVPKDNFSQTGFEGLEDLFQQVVLELLGQAFVPISGNNAAGVADSITYQDPLGEYMELKNGAITVEKGTVTGSSEKTFDMSMLLFGEMHGLVRAGVYDYQWNNKYMHDNDAKTGYPNPNVNPDEEPLEIGWYKGDAENAVYSYDKVTGLPEGCTSAADAWAQGWVLRLDYKTLAEFVPISGITDTMKPTEVPEQIKHTVYTCYRFADSQVDRNKLRCNPIFGEVTDSLQKEWQNYFDTYGSYPVGKDFYSDYSGIYRLSDIRVWAEHTGDYVDQTGAITPEEESGYDDSLYVNVPVSAVPTQLAEITIGAEGPISYKDNLNDKKQSTPVRLFYAVGLTEDLILRDADGNQTGVDVSKISGEYIESHSDPETNNIHFISNWYSNTAYRGYTSDAAEEYRTRGDAAVTFSPNEKNRYYLFQKPLPLIAHAYRVTDGEGNVAPVDNADGKVWGDNGAGNGETTWEDGKTGGATWSGGEFIGTYESEATFKTALGKKFEKDGVWYITDEKNYAYPLPQDIKDAVITYTEDQLSKVDSDTSGGYASGSNSFSSDDYFFLCIEYYLPMEGAGKDIHGNEDPNTQAVRKVSRMIARKGSAFGSGLHSENIDNGDMLCWTDINGNCTSELEYNSRTDTGDNTRGRPTLQKLTYTGNDLRTYLESIGLSGKYLEDDVKYWTSVQADPHMAALIEEIKKADKADDRQAKFDELFDWSVAARTGGIRVGDMFNNMQAKLSADEIKNGTGPTFGDYGFYAGNVTKTANNYYIPTLSEISTAGEGLVVNNFLGNNGRLEVANSTLMVTKTLEAPDEFTLIEKQQNEIFNYQVYVQGLTGERLAQRLKWNPFSQSWQKRVESLDILTDNASLLVDTNGSRALFCYESGVPRQIVEVYEDGVPRYYYADATGAATDTPCTHTSKDFYYLYLPNSAGEQNYHLFASTYEKGTTELSGVGTTAYYPTEMDTSDLPAGDNGGQQFAPAITGKPDEMDNRRAGSREYWTKEAVLIPFGEVTSAEDWAYDSAKLNVTYKDLKEQHFTLVTVIPDPAGIDSTVYSPYRSRTQYMTVPLYFGYTAELAEHLKECSNGGAFADCKHLQGYELKGTGLYDKIIPSADRPDLFGNSSGELTLANGEKLKIDNDYIAAHTAEFTLKHGEGLMLTGLGNRITYRFTEKLSDTQIKKSYFLKEISHVQQRGSDTVYKPGVQEIRVDGKSEPFAHTNATIWESYATMAAGALGNHHQPEASGEVAQNPSCLKQLDAGGCDLAQDDGSTRHYFYYGGKLVDPHYTGEQSGMSHYVLNPTAHFGVEGETQHSTTLTAENPESGKYDYSDVYSVFGNTGYFTEQVNYTNTYIPDVLIVSKELTGVNGTQINDADRDKDFTFRVSFLLPAEGATPARYLTSPVYYWKGKTAELAKAPLPNTDDVKKLSTLSPEKNLQTYLFTLKADESIVFYSLPIDTVCTVTEQEHPNYPIDEGESYSVKNTVTRTAFGGDWTKTTENKVLFKNTKPAGILTVEKYVENIDPDPDKVFKFTVKLISSAAGATPEKLVVQRFAPDETVTEEKLSWNVESGVWTAEFTLHHNEKISISKIPLGTQYTVSEDYDDDYRLQRTENGSGNLISEDSASFVRFDRDTRSVTGTVPDSDNVYIRFVNAPTLIPPFVGGLGWTPWYILGVLLVTLPLVAAIVYGRRRRSM